MRLYLPTWAHFLPISPEKTSYTVIKDFILKSQTLDNSMVQVQHPPFWGLTLSLDPEAHVLVIDDNPDERYAIVNILLHKCHLTWATTPPEASAAFSQHGPYDIYMLDYDLGDTRGGWLPTAELIRKEDPHSIAKVIIVHSANPDAWIYRTLFPTALVIQWMAFATLLGVPLVDRSLIDQVLNATDPSATADTLRAAALKITNPAPSPHPNSSQTHEVSS